MTKKRATTSKTKESLKLPAILFDLDGTLIDSVYDHVLSWSATLREAGIDLPHWKIHRRVGMSGKSFMRELLREIGRTDVRPDEIEEFEKAHGAEFSKRIPTLRPLPGTRQLLDHLNSVGVQFAIATTGNLKDTKRLLKIADVPEHIPIVTGDDVAKTKPAPDVFVLAAEQLGVSIRDSVVVGDSTWDLLAAVRKSALGVGLLSGGYGQDELERAGAFRIYENPADLLMHIEQLGIPGA